MYISMYETSKICFINIYICIFLWIIQDLKCVCLCVCVRVYVCACVHMCVRVRVYLCVRVHACMRVYMYVCAPVSTCINSMEGLWFHVCLRINYTI